LIYARGHIGLREIPGPRHAPGIMAMVRRAARFLGIDVNSDETPWCGTFVADCMWTGSGITPPKIAVRAKAWATWGRPIAPCLGAVLVFGRQGGGHVGFYVAEDDTAFHVLGGNQGNAVSITRIAKTRLEACRWPALLDSRTSRVFVQSNGKPLSRNEA
jgi:uncharacterized protein (TIGR02594 family)